MQNDAKEKKRKENKYIFDIIENRAKQVLHFFPKSKIKMKKSVNPQAIEITRRFFQALNLAIELGKVDGIKGFCEAHHLNRVKYATLKMTIDKPVDEMTYKCIDVDALAGICNDFGVSAEWLLLGRGKMLKTDAK